MILIVESNLTSGKRLKLYSRTRILVFFATCGLNPNKVCPEGGAGGKVNSNERVYSLYGGHFRTSQTLEAQLGSTFIGVNLRFTLN